MPYTWETPNEPILNYNVENIPIEEYIANNPEINKYVKEVGFYSFPKNVIISSNWLKQVYGQKNWGKYAKLYKDEGYNVYLHASDLKEKAEEYYKQTGQFLLDPIGLAKKNGFLTEEDIAPSKERKGLFDVHFEKIIPQAKKEHIAPKWLDLASKSSIPAVSQLATVSKYLAEKHPQATAEPFIDLGNFIYGTYDSIKNNIKDFYYNTPYAKFVGPTGIYYLLSHDKKEIDRYLKWSSEKEKRIFNYAIDTTKLYAGLVSATDPIVKTNLALQFKEDVGNLAWEISPVVKGINAVVNTAFFPAMLGFGTIDEGFKLISERLTNPHFAQNHPEWYGLLSAPTGYIFGLGGKAVSKSLQFVGVRKTEADLFGELGGMLLMGKAMEMLHKGLKRWKNKKVKEPIIETVEPKITKEEPPEEKPPEKNTIGLDFQHEVEILNELSEIQEAIEKAKTAEEKQEWKEKFRKLMERLRDISLGRIKPTYNEEQKPSKPSKPKEPKPPLDIASIKNKILNGDFEGVEGLLDSSKEQFELELQTSDLPEQNKTYLGKLYNDFYNFFKNKVKEFQESKKDEAYRNFSNDYFLKFSKVIETIVKSIDDVDDFVKKFDETYANLKEDSVDIKAPSVIPETLKPLIGDLMYKFASGKILEMLDKGELEKEEALNIAHNIHQHLNNILKLDINKAKTIDETLKYVQKSLQTLIQPAVEIRSPDLFSPPSEYNPQGIGGARGKKNPTHIHLIKKFFDNFKEHIKNTLEKVGNIKDVSLNKKELLRGLNFVVDVKRDEKAGKGVKVFHGTSKKFEVFNTDVAENELMPDRALGVHFTRDRKTAEYFARSGEQVIRHITLDIKKPYKLPQVKGHIDQYDFQIDIARVVFPRRKDLFVRYFHLRRNLPEDVLSEIYDKIKQGKDISNPKLQLTGEYKDKFADLANNYGLVIPDDINLLKEIVKEYRKALEEQGYDSIQYINTGVEETAEAKDKTAYVVWNKDLIKSDTFHADSYMVTPAGDIVPFMPSNKEKYIPFILNIAKRFGDFTKKEISQKLKDFKDKYLIVSNVSGGKKVIFPRFNTVLNFLYKDKNIKQAILGKDLSKTTFWDVYGGGLGLSLNMEGVSEILDKGGKVKVGVAREYNKTTLEYIDFLKRLTEKQAQKVHEAYQKIYAGLKEGKYRSTPTRTGRQHNVIEKMIADLREFLPADEKVEIEQIRDGKKKTVEVNLRDELINRFSNLPEPSFRSLTATEDMVKNFMRVWKFITHPNVEILEENAKEIYSKIHESILQSQPDEKHIIVDDSDYPPPTGEYPASVYSREGESGQAFHTNEPFYLLEQKRELFKTAYTKGHTIIMFNHVTPEVMNFLGDFHRQITMSYKIAGQGMGKNIFYGNLGNGRPEFFSIISKDLLQEHTLPVAKNPEIFNSFVKFSIPHSELSKITQEKGANKERIIQEIAKHEAVHIAVEQLPPATLDNLSELFGIKDINKEKNIEHKTAKIEAITNILSNLLEYDEKTGNFEIDSDKLPQNVPPEALDIINGYLNAKTDFSNLAIRIGNQPDGKGWVFRFFSKKNIESNIKIDYNTLKKSEGEKVYDLREEVSTNGKVEGWKVRKIAFDTMRKLYQDIADKVKSGEITPIEKEIPMVYSVYNKATGELRIGSIKDLPLAKLLTEPNELQKLKDKLTNFRQIQQKQLSKDEKLIMPFSYRFFMDFAGLPTAVADFKVIDTPDTIGHIRYKRFNKIMVEGIANIHKIFLARSDKEMEKVEQNIEKLLQDGRLSEDFNVYRLEYVPKTTRGEIRHIGYAVAPNSLDASSLLMLKPIKEELMKNGYDITRIVIRDPVNAKEVISQLRHSNDVSRENLLENANNKMGWDEDASQVATLMHKDTPKIASGVVSSMLESVKLKIEEKTGMPLTMPSITSKLAKNKEKTFRRMAKFYRESFLGKTVSKILTPNQKALSIWGIVNPVTEYARIISEKTFKTSLIKDWLNKKVLDKIPQMSQEARTFLLDYFNDPDIVRAVKWVLANKEKQTVLLRQINSVIANIYERFPARKVPLEVILQVLDKKHEEAIKDLETYFPEAINEKSEYSVLRAKLFDLMQKYEEAKTTGKMLSSGWEDIKTHYWGKVVSLAETDDNIGIFLLTGIDPDKLSADRQAVYMSFLESKRAQNLMEKYSKEIELLKNYMKHAKNEMVLSGMHTREGDYLPFFLPDVFFKQAKVGKNNAPYIADWFARTSDIPLYPDLHQSLMKYVELHRLKVDFAEYIEKWRQQIYELKEPAERDYWKKWLENNIAPPKLMGVDKFVNNIKNFMAMKLLLASFSASLKHMVKLSLTFQAHGVKGTLHGLKELYKGVLGEGSIANVIWGEKREHFVNNLIHKANVITTKILGEKLLVETPKERKTLVELYDKLNPNAKLLLQVLTEREALRSITERIEDWDTMIKTKASGSMEFFRKFIRKHTDVSEEEAYRMYNDITNKGKNFFTTLAKRLSFVSYTELFENGLNLYATIFSLTKNGYPAEMDILQFKDAVMNSLLLHNFRGGYDSWLNVKNPYVGSMMLFQTTPAKIFLHTAYSLMEGYLDIKHEGLEGFLKKTRNDPYSAGRQVIRLMVIAGLITSLDELLETHFLEDLFPVPFTTDWVFGKGAIGSKGIVISPMFQTILYANEKGVGKALSREATYWGGLTKLARIIADDIPKIYEGNAVRYLFSVPREFPAQRKKKGKHKKYHMTMKEPDLIDSKNTLLKKFNYLDLNKPLK